MLIGRPLLRRCCSPSPSKIPNITQLSSTKNHPIIAIGSYKHQKTIAIGSISGIHPNCVVIRRYSTDGGHQDGSDGRNNASKPPVIGSPARWNTTRQKPSDQGTKVELPPELAKGDDDSVANDWDDFDDLEEPGSNSRLASTRDREADEEFFAILDKQRRERASQNIGGVKSAEPSNKTLEDTSRFLLSELLAKDTIRKPGYKKSPLDGNESDIALLQKALDVSITRIQKNAKPGYHPLPFYLHKNSKDLDDALKVVLWRGQPAVVNKVCYNLLISDAAPTINTFNILIRRFTKLRMTASAHVILSTLFAIGFEPNAVTYAAMLQYLTVTQNYEAFNRAVQIMRDTFLDYQNPVLGAAELNGWSKFGNFMGMRRRLRLLQEEGLRDDIYILTIELRYFAKRHMWEGGLPALTLLLKKEAQDIDHRALFWAFKLCANCQQPDFADRLKAIAQEKRWPVESLWTRPRRARGLPYGYVGRKSGQLVPKGTDPPQWTELWNPGVKSKEFWEVQKPDIKLASRVPDGWREYSLVFWDEANGEDGGVIMKSWKKPVLEGVGQDLSSLAVKAEGAEKTSPGAPNSQAKPSTKISGGESQRKEHETDTAASEASNAADSLPANRFKVLKAESLWKSLLKRRKRELLRPETRGPKS